MLALILSAAAFALAVSTLVNLRRSAASLEQARENLLRMSERLDSLDRRRNGSADA